MCSPNTADSNPEAYWSSRQRATPKEAFDLAQAQFGTRMKAFAIIDHGSLSIDCLTRAHDKPQRVLYQKKRVENTNQVHSDCGNHQSEIAARRHVSKAEMLETVARRHFGKAEVL